LGDSAKNGLSVKKALKIVARFRVENRTKRTRKIRFTKAQRDL